MSSDGIIRIVIGVDFTQVGDHALDEAIRYARVTDRAELHPVFVIAEDRSRNLEQTNDALTKARDALRDRLVARSDAASWRGEQNVVFHVRIGDPVEVLHQVAVDVDGDLIVVGTHGRRGLEKMLLGSVAEKLVRTARVPVLVARPKQIEDLPRTERPDPADPSRDIHQQRVMASERLTLGRRSSHISGLV
jgi:nucleotide-binding universal stress UspA family protein